MQHRTLDAALKNNGFRCMCNRQLTFEPGLGGVVVCHCLKCNSKSEEDGAVIYVRGHGLTEQQAYDSWRDAQNGM